jgi:hypothetical protein
MTSGLCISESNSFSALGWMIDIGHNELDGLTGDDFVRRICELYENLMLARNQSNENNCLATGINEVPWLIVDGDMYMTNSRRYFQGTFSKNWNDPQVLCSVLNEDAPLSQRLFERRIYNQSGRRFVIDGKQE